MMRPVSGSATNAENACASIDAAMARTAARSVLSTVRSPATAVATCSARVGTWCSIVQVATVSKDASG